MISSSAGQSYFENKSRCGTVTISMPSEKIDTSRAPELPQAGGAVVARTSDSGKTFLINRVAASRSCSPPSQFFPKERSKMGPSDSEPPSASVRSTASVRRAGGPSVIMRGGACRAGSWRPDTASANSSIARLDGARVPRGAGNASDGRRAERLPPKTNRQTTFEIAQVRSGQNIRASVAHFDPAPPDGRIHTRAANTTPTRLEACPQPLLLLSAPHSHLTPHTCKKARHPTCMFSARLPCLSLRPRCIRIPFLAPRLNARTRIAPPFSSRRYV